MTISAGRKASFHAVTDFRTRVLILGSLPGDKSLKMYQYYANPRNQFWRLVGPLIDIDLCELPYADRLAALLDAGIGLWDVIKSAQRTGSSDSEIRRFQPNKLNDFALSLPSLSAIAFNGGKPSAIGRRQLEVDCNYKLVTLPSSSAAYCAISFDKKLSEWLQLRHFLS